MHQWLDQNGWEHRKTYIEDRNGNIYEATLNIANGRDRRILYAINNIRKIDEKRDTRGAVPSTENGRGSLTKGISTGDTLAENAGVVNAENSQELTFEEQYGLKLPRLDDEENTGKQKFSISPSTVAKRDVISDLRGILQRGGDPAELRRYVENMERGADNVDQNGFFAEQSASEAEQIVQAARKQGISVSQYLRWNWEQYEVDGEWNAAARQALEQEWGGRRRYSISAPEATETSAPNTTNPHQNVNLAENENLSFDQNGIDKTAVTNENSGIEKVSRGEMHDNSRVRKGTTEAAESGSYHGSATPRSTENAPALQGWENISQNAKRKIRKIVSKHINTSTNSAELYYFSLTNAIGWCSLRLS